MTVRGPAPSASAMNGVRASVRARRVAYRVVQEGLTNALEHAPGSAIGLSVCVDSEVRLGVVDGAGVMSSVLGSVGGGHGPVGLRQRVSDLGRGNLDVGHDTGVGRLSVRVPATSQRTCPARTGDSSVERHFDSGPAT